jgi:Tfp pilus assembly protein PilO
MKGWRQHPLAGHALIVVMLLASIGLTRAVYLEPRSREIRALRVDETKVRAQILDLQAGLEDMKAWARAHPGRDLLAFQVRRPRPVRDMVPAFLTALAPIATRYRVQTEVIQPAGTPTDTSIPDAAGQPVVYRRVDLRLRVYASYQDLGEYLHEVESLDQLVVVHSVSIQYHAPTYPSLVADVAIWVYGTP